MTRFGILLILASFSLTAWGQGRKPEEQCKEILGVVGEEKPITVIFPYVSWGDFHAQRKATTTGLAEVSVTSFYTPEKSRNDNLVACSRLNQMNTDFTLFVKPNLTDIPASKAFEFKYLVRLNLNPDLNTDARVTVLESSTSTDNCVLAVSAAVEQYFHTASDSKSKAFWKDWNDDENPFRQSWLSYCNQLTDGINNVIRNQFE